MTDSPRRWWGLLAIGASTFLIVAQFWAAWDQLPDPMATHWRFAGSADGATPKRLLSAILTVPLWVLAVISLVTTSRVTRATLFTLCFIFGAFFAALTWSLVTLNAGVEYWRQAREIPLSHLALLSVTAVTAGLLGGLAFRRTTSGREAAMALHMLELTSAQRAVWLGSAHNRWLWVIGALPTLAALSSVTAPSSTKIILGCVAGLSLVLADAFSSVRVKADRHGVHVTCGYLGLIRKRIALADIDHAEAFQLVPMAHGGWGYRGSLWLMRRAAIVVRGGSALRLALQSGKELSVTVDNADDGASLINGMVRLR